MFDVDWNCDPDASLDFDQNLDLPVDVHLDLDLDLHMGLDLGTWTFVCGLCTFDFILQLSDFYFELYRLRLIFRFGSDQIR